MSARHHDAELEAHLRKVIREELEAARKSRTDMLLVDCGPFFGRWSSSAAWRSQLRARRHDGFGLGRASLAARRRTDSETA